MKIREFANKTVRHSDPLPKLSKPTTGREQEHPYTGMLVGSKYSEDQDTGMYNPKRTKSKRLKPRYLCTTKRKQR